MINPLSCWLFEVMIIIHLRERLVGTTARSEPATAKEMSPIIGLKPDGFEGIDIHRTSERCMFLFLLTIASPF